MSSAGSRDADVSLREQSLTRTGGKYLCGIFRCGLRAGNRVATGDLAACLDVSRASVTEMVEKFGESVLVDYERYQGATLTADGEALARHLRWRRCVTERFFEDELDFSPDPETAYRVGFELPEEGTNRMAEIVEHPCDRQCSATDPDDCSKLSITPP
ncbi:MAG: metal-dependent transcriptional regulator [Halorhabdus sp.]